MSVNGSGRVVDLETRVALHGAADTEVRNESAILVSSTLPWSEILHPEPADGSLLGFLSRAPEAPRVYWESEKFPVGFAGYGAAVVLTAAGPDRFRTIHRQLTRLFENAVLEAEDTPPVAGPRLFGGFSFEAGHTPGDIWTAFPSAYFVLPRYQLTHFEGRSWLTVNRLVPADESKLWLEVGAVREPPLPRGRVSNGLESHWHTGLRLLAGEIHRVGSGVGERINHHPYRRSGLDQPGRQYDMNCQMDSETWCRRVNEAVHRIRRGELDKVVLARTCDVHVDGSIRPMEVLARLKRQYPDCYRFLIEPVHGHAFFGATPELLVEVTGSTLHTVALAGSIGRGNSPAEDAALGQALMSSPKDRQEHGFVVEAIEESLRPLVKRLDMPAHPTVLRLRNIQHLQTIICGEVGEECGVLPAVESLHPTPAVGGVPRISALRMITEMEPQPRGWYAAPVGWVDPQGNGLFNVAIRSAVSVGNRARMYAGAGIVADSDPEREWEETGLKFRPMLEALGADRKWPSPP